MSIKKWLDLKRLRAVPLAVVLSFALFAANSAFAEKVKLRGAHINPKSYIQSGVIFEKWASLVEERSGGEIEINIVHGGALLGVKDHVDGISSGLVDLVSFYPIYFPGEFRVEGALTNILDIWSDNTPDLGGIAKIHAQLHSEFDVFKTEYSKRNMRMLVPLPVDPYIVACAKPVTSLADLKGRKMRSFGRYFPVLQEYMGVEPISVPGPEAYGALSTGVIDCIYTTPSFILSNKFHEVAPYAFIPAPKRARPQALCTAVIAMNEKSFGKLSEKHRKIIEDVSKEMLPIVGEMMKGVYDKSVQQIAEATKNPVRFMSKSDFKAWQKRTPNMLDQAATDLTEAGYPGKEIIARYRELANAHAK